MRDSLAEEERKRREEEERRRRIEEARQRQEAEARAARLRAEVAMREMARPPVQYRQPPQLDTGILGRPSIRQVAQQQARRRLGADESMFGGFVGGLEATGRTLDIPRQQVGLPLARRLIPDIEGRRIPLPMLPGLSSGTRPVRISSPVAEEVVSMALDPLNLLPGVGWGGDIARAARRLPIRGLAQGARAGAGRYLGDVAEAAPGAARAGVAPFGLRVPEAVTAAREIPPMTPGEELMQLVVKENQQGGNLRVRQATRNIETEGPRTLTGVDARGRRMRAQGTDDFLRDTLRRQMEPERPIETAGRERAARYGLAREEMTEALQLAREGEARAFDIEKNTRLAALIKKATLSQKEQIRGTALPPRETAGPMLERGAAEAPPPPREPPLQMRAIPEAQIEEARTAYAAFLSAAEDADDLAVQSTLKKYLQRLNAIDLNNITTKDLLEGFSKSPDPVVIQAINNEFVRRGFDPVRFMSQAQRQGLGARPSTGGVPRSTAVRTAGPLFERGAAEAPPPREPPPPPPPPREPPLGTAGGLPPGEPPASIRNKYVAPLREFGAVEKEVVTSENPVVRAAIGKTGINPSVLQNTPEGRALTAYFRQRSSAEGLTEVAVSAAYDAPAQGVTGLRRVRIGADARVQNITVPPGKSDVWYDVFTHYKEYPLSAAQRSEVEGFLQVVRETEQMRLAAGLKPRTMQEALEDVFYVPRQVKVIRGVELRRPSRPNLQRHYEEAQEGIAAGVKYDSSPRDVLELHVRAAYREIIEKQLTDALEPLSITAKQLVPEPVRIRMENAVKQRLAAERGRRALTVSRATEAIAPGEVRTVRGKVTAARHAADAQLAAARKEYAFAKNAYGRAMEAARKAEVAPGSLFGRSEEAIAIGSWRNRFFPRDQANYLQETLGSFLRSPEHANALSRGIELIGNYTRFLASVGDFAEPFIQGLPLLARNPVAWSRTALRHYQAFFDPGVQARYIREHLETFQWMAQNNIPIGDVEFFAAIQRGGGVSAVGEQVAKLPGGAAVREVFRGVGKQTVGRFQQSYNTGLGVGRAQMVEAIKPTWKGTDADLATYIRNMSGGLDTKALGVGPTQRGFESMWLAFSPRLLRSTISLIADLRLNPLTSPRGRESWRTLTSLVSGVTAMYVLTGKALGKPDEEILGGLNPLNGKRFLSHEINGDWIGVGGQVRAITQLLAATASAAAPGGRPIEDLISKDMWDNPLLAFYTSRGAPAMNIVGGVVEATTGLNALQYENISGIPDLLKHMGTSALPFALQGVLEGENALTSGAGLLGARTSAGTLSERRNTITQERWGKDYYDLDLPQRQQADTDPQITDLNKQIDEQQRQRGDKYQVAQDEVDRQIAPIREAQATDDAAAMSGKMNIDLWKDETSRRMVQQAQIRDSVYAARGVTFEEKQNLPPVRAALEAYFAISPEIYRDAATREVDWQKFFDARDAALASLSATDRTAAQSQIEKNLTPFQKRFREASRLLDTMPSKYKGVTADRAREIDEFVFSEVPDMTDRYVLKIGREISPKVVAQALSQQRGDPELYRFYINLRSEKKREALLNPSYYTFLRDNYSTLITFYPSMYDSKKERAALGFVAAAPEFGRPRRISRRVERAERPRRMTRMEQFQAAQDKRDLLAILRID